MSFKTIWENNNIAWCFNIYDTKYDGDKPIKIYKEDVVLIKPYIKKDIEFTLNKNIDEILNNYEKQSNNYGHFIGASFYHKELEDWEGYLIQVVKFKFSKSYIYKIEITDTDDYETIHICYFCGSYNKFIDYMKTRLISLCLNLLEEIAIDYDWEY